MGALNLLRKLLRVRSISASKNDQANTEYGEPISNRNVPNISTNCLLDAKANAKATKLPPQRPSSSKTTEDSRKLVAETVPIPKFISSNTNLSVGEFIHEERPEINYNEGILRNTFIHLKGIGDQKEYALWQNGVLTHDDALTNNVLATRKSCLLNSKQALLDRNWYSFYEGMRPKDHWRLFGDLVEETAYIDIETTGLSSSTDVITTAIVHSHRSTHVFVNGMNLDGLPSFLSRFNLIVTYNGKCFDIPFIERYFGATVTTPHIDLRYVLAGMGYKGGLKSCERQLNLPIRKGMEEIDGYTAVLLWDYFCRTKDQRSLETLLAYNYEDSVRLEWLMIEAYNQKVSELPFDSNKLQKPSLPLNPYTSHSAVLRSI